MSDPEKGLAEGAERAQLVKTYRRIFDWKPELKDLASSYWDQMGLLDLDDPRTSAIEEGISGKIVIQMADILLDNPVFKRAIREAGVDPLDTAIQESLAMIDIIPDLKAGGKNFDKTLRLGVE